MTKRTSTPKSGDAERCVALDLGALIVRAVELDRTGSDVADGGYRVSRWGSAALPAGFWSDPESNLDAFVRAIQQAISGAGISTHSVVACLPRWMVTLRAVRLPQSPPDEMRNMVAFEAQQYILYSLDEVILDYHVLPPDGSDMSTVLLVAARKGLIATVVNAFDRVGVELEQLSVSSLALAEHLRDSEETAALIDLSEGEVDIVVVSNGRPLFTRAASLDIHDASARTAGPRAIEEVIRSFTAYQNEFRARPPATMYVVGKAAGFESEGDELRALSDALDIPVIPLSNRMLPPHQPELRAYARAVGMALQSQQGSIAPINLVPSERSEMQAREARSRRQKLAGVLVGVVALAGVAFALNNMKKQANENSAMLAANTKLEDEQKYVDKRQKQVDQLVALTTDLQTGLDRSHPMVDIMVALDKAMPSSADIWLTQLSLTRSGTITIRGDSKQPGVATDLLLHLQGSGAFHDVRLSYLGDTQDANVDTTGTPDTVTDAGTGQSSGDAAVTPLPGMGGKQTTTPGIVSPGMRALPGGLKKRGPALGGGTLSAVPLASGAAKRGAGRLPSISAGTPSGSAGKASASGAANTASVPPAERPKGTLTGFVITCRINQKTRDLVRAATAAAKSAGDNSSGNAVAAGNRGSNAKTQ